MIFFNIFDAILIFQVLVAHLLEFALFGLDLHTILRATRVFIFLVGLRITRCMLARRDGTRR